MDECHGCLQQKFGVIWKHMGPFGIILGHLVTISDHLGIVSGDLGGFAPGMTREQDVAAILLASQQVCERSVLVLR